MKICVSGLLSLLVGVNPLTSQRADAIEKTPRYYTAKSNDGATFRWRTSLDVILDTKPIQCGSLHDKLRIITDEAAQSISKEKNDGINSSVAAASLTVVFLDKEGNLIEENEPIYATIYGFLDDAVLSSSVKVKKNRLPWFTTMASKRMGTIGYHTPITYAGKAKLEESAKYIFGQIGLNKKDERLFKKSSFVSKNVYSYVDAEFQIIHELFYNGHFFPILSALKEKHRNDAILLIILHIHTPLDLCSMCTDVLCKYRKPLTILLNVY
jgi:hypothetical protein